MNRVLLLLGAAPGGEAVSPWYKLSAGAREWIIIFAAVGAVTVLVLIWALFFRKHHQVRSHRYSHDWSSAADVEDSKDADPVPRKRRKWRRRRREHRARNPTLAETGGLPPARSGAPRGPSV